MAEGENRMNQAYGWKQIGSRLSACRQNKNMTQEELAGRLGVTPQALSKWERGLSFPDISMLAELSGLLGIRTDYLLGIESRHETDGGGVLEAQIEIGNCLRNALEPLELIFGKDLIALFGDNRFREKIEELRKRLAREGILLPILRIRDELELDTKEFMVLAYRNVLCSEIVEAVDENTLDYMIQKLCECVREKYYEILNPDMVKELAENLKIRFPALVEGVIPDRISYGLLTDILKKAMAQGVPIAYLPKAIETIDSTMRDNPKSTAAELAEQVKCETLRDDNYSNVMAKRK